MHIPSLTASVQIACAALIGFSAGIINAAEDITATGAAPMPPAEHPAGVLPPSLQNEADMAVDRGLDWLAAHQRDDGSWSTADFPAVSALALWTFTHTDHPRKAQVVSNAVAYILSCVRDDGGIYRDIEGRKGGGLSNYNTAICMTALHAVGWPSLHPVILRARTFLAESQYFGDDHFKGGMGYDASTKRAYTDLLNTYYASEAMRLTQDTEDFRSDGADRADLDWKAVQEFLARLQNDKDSTPQDAGGFFYNPVDPKAGTATNEQGVIVFHSYGSITYAGIMTLLYADVGRTDPRVQSALDWSQRHWTLDENPGLGAHGLFFFYNVLTKCLAAYGVDRISAQDGMTVDWRHAMVNRLLSLQKIDPSTGRGYWVNDNGKWMENDPVLVTAYSLLALEIAAGY